MLEELLSFLSGLETWEEAPLESALTQFCNESLEGKMGSMAPPIRIALTGGPVSPPIFATLAVLPKQEVLDRIQACLEAHAQ